MGLYLENDIGGIFKSGLSIIFSGFYNDKMYFFI